MQPQRDLAIVLRSIPYEDRHRIVTALTESRGQITALARNCIQSRRFGGTLEPFAASEWQFTERPGAELVSLKEAQIRRAYEGLRKDFERLSLASVFNEIMLKIAPQKEACPDLFRLHSNALAALEEAPGNGADISLLNGYLAKLLQWNGTQPQFAACSECQRPFEEMTPDTHLSCLVSDAAWICPDCRISSTRHVRERQGESFQQSLLRVSAAAMRDFQVSLAVPIRQISSYLIASKEQQRELFRYLEALFVYHVPGFDKQPLKGLRFIDLESNVPPPAANPR